jgi:hypothetical protein
MYLQEYVEQGGIWGIINGLCPSPLPFVVEQTPDQLDANFIFMYGERLIIDKVEKHSKDYVCKLIVSLFYEKWVSQIQALSGDIDLSASNIKVREEVEEENTTETQVKDTENKVASYNETSLATETGVSDNQESEGNKNVNRTITEKTTDLAIIFKNLQTLQKLDIMQAAAKDVAKTISHSIY